MFKQKNYNQLIKIFSKGFLFKNFLKLYHSGKKEISLKTLNGSLKSVFVSSIRAGEKVQLAVITADRNDANDWYHDLSILAEGDLVVNFTKPQKHTKLQLSDHDATQLWLGESLSQMISTDNLIILTPEILRQKLPSPDKVNSSLITLSSGQTIDYDEFCVNLALNGFERVDFIANPGEIAVRGGIVDIFPLGWDNPVRIEFWGNDIESIREFDIISQRSIANHDTIKFLNTVFHESEDKSDFTIIDYLDTKCLIVLDNPDILKILDFEESSLADFRIIKINPLGPADIEISSESQPQINSSVKDLAVNLKKLILDKSQIFIGADGDIHLKRLGELVENAFNVDDSGQELDDADTVADGLFSLIHWFDQSLSSGFMLKDEGIAYFTEHQIFNRKVFHSGKKSRAKSGISLKELKQLLIGDLIVHEDKGIGKFDGFQNVMLGGSYQDCVRLIYDGGDILYVHLNYIHKIQKYSAADGVIPALSRLGSSEWIRKKARTKKRLKDIARDLIKLYSERKSQPGFGYPADSIWQKEFEAAFIYEDTPDQAKSTEEVKADMESNTPMDRLVCGDVGFGKTEIAIRAAFKAVQSGKQVAVLVPTTILAKQHYMTFIDRMNRYPVIIESLSRFKTKKEQTDIVGKLKNGNIDVLIGTHRILSKDISFKDMGLLIIDEEHRFGVASKEKLRQMRVNVDTLTLTATPIPRTLNFSLMGARDLSIIETPPKNRIPVYTEILEWNNNIIKEAVQNELARGGQVFFVNDRIEDLDKIASDLKMLLPGVRIGTAHGQLQPAMLEKVMEKFIEGHYDVLVTTKIVESGLDIPNANTMIINRSNNFGLAELYQLRGRVGRTNIQAFCYLLIPPVKTLSRKALQRLQAIEEFTDLGSGFQLAMRDLEIRGAGNLLGAEQSGFINEIGFDLYQKILEETVNELKYEEFRDIFKDAEVPQNQILENNDISIEIDTDALIPAYYIANDTERFHYYKKLYNLRTNTELKEIQEELTDRFGKIPDELDGLLFVVKLRLSSLYTGLQKIILKKNKLIAEFPDKSNQLYYENFFPVITEFIQELPHARLTESRKSLMLETSIGSRDLAVELLWRLKKTLETIAN